MKNRLLGMFMLGVFMTYFLPAGFNGLAAEENNDQSLSEIKAEIEEKFLELKNECGGFINTIQESIKIIKEIVFLCKKYQKEFNIPDEKIAALERKVAYLFVAAKIPRIHVELVEIEIALTEDNEHECLKLLEYINEQLGNAKMEKDKINTGLERAKLSLQDLQKKIREIKNKNQENKNLHE